MGCSARNTGRLWSQSPLDQITAMKILLVEDSATLRHAMAQYVREAGHSPLLARSGEEALQLLESTPVELIIMDVEMPGLNGFETTRLIREWLGDHWIPIIFVTGKSEDESYREGIEAGGDDYLIKPVSSVIIKAKIRAMARIAEMRDQLNQLNAELEALSQVDSLTQALNRRTFNDQAQQHWRLAKRRQTPTSVLMIDVDHFKPYNDHYGHPAGDRCLKAITDSLQNCLHRPADLLGRYGGEEFVVLLPETDRNGTRSVASKALEAVRQLALEHKYSSAGPRVTVSIGGATCNHPLGHDLEELIKCADRALYKAKHAGRDRALVEELAAHRTVLIGASCSDMMQEISATLRDHCNLLTADKEDECLDIAREVLPDLIILDNDMVNRERGALSDSLTQHPLTCAIPVLVLMAEGEESETPLLSHSSHARNWVSERFHPEELCAQVQRLLD